MIKVKYYASAKDAGDYELYGVDYDEYGMYFIDNVQDEVKEIKDIFNYANFFEDGIVLNDASVQFGDESDYYGWLIFGSVSDNIVWADFRGSANPADLENGIDITFNKYTCKKIEVYFDNGNSVTMIGEANNENGLPEKVHIVLDSNIDYSELAQVKIVFTDPTIEGDPINVKGIYFGNLIEIESVFDFDMISETNPISDDLAINEMNLTTTIEEDFVGGGGQIVQIYDGDMLIEEDILKSIKEQDLNIYDIKSQSKLSELDKIQVLLFQKEIALKPDEDDFFWNWGNVFTVQDVIQQIKEQTGFEIVADKLIRNQYIDPLQFSKEPMSVRKILQQLSWAACCRVDTTIDKNIQLITVLAEEAYDYDVIIKDEDDRTLLTNIDIGEQYSKIIWKIPTYLRSQEIEKIGEAKLAWNPYNSTLEGTFVSSEPFYAYQSEGGPSYVMLNPYSAKVSLEYDEQVTTNIVDVMGFAYKKSELEVEIYTGIKNAGTLEITNQQGYLPNFQEYKTKQLQTWYSHNNTLSATVVDNENEIRVGKIIKIQLKKGNYFQGVITKVIRNSINDYHTVELEAHEWD